MSKNKTATAQAKPTSATCFKFGDPERVLSASPADYLGVFCGDGTYYSPPVSLNGLSKLLRANGHHGTIPPFKRNRLVQFYKPNNTLSPQDLGRGSIDYDVFGNAYFQKIFNGFGQVVQFKHLPAINMRRMKELDTYCQLRKNGEPPVEFKPGEVVHLMEYDVCQQIYGIPQYLGGINAVLLNEDSTLFRRKYYINGAHMGYILYTSDSSMSVEDEEMLKKQIKESKGVGNFRSLYLHIPNGKKDSVQIIPVGDIATKDEYERITNITRADIIAMWRIQPALAGIMPLNPGGFGDIEKIGRLYFEYETVPMQDVFLQLNQHLTPARHIKFGKPEGALAVK